MFGRCIPQANVLPDVVGGERHRAVSAVVRHGQRAFEADGGDGPGVPVAHGFTVRCDDVAVVAPRRDDVADVGVLATSDLDRNIRVDAAGGEPGLLDGAVDRVDVVVGRYHHRDGSVLLMDGDPRVRDADQMLVEGAGD